MDTAPTRSRGRLALWAATAATLLLVLSFAQTDLGNRTMQAIGLSPPPIPFVELFFDDRVPPPPSLPANVSITVPVGFVVGNGTSEGRPVAWSVTQSPPVAGAGASQGTALLGLAERRVVQTTLRIRCVGPSIELAVQVVDGTSLITRSIRCTPPRRTR